MGSSRLAQSVEHETLNLGVAGSNPSSGWLRKHALLSKHLEELDSIISQFNECD